MGIDCNSRSTGSYACQMEASAGVDFGKFFHGRGDSREEYNEDPRFEGSQISKRNSHETGSNTVASADAYATCAALLVSALGE